MSQDGDEKARLLAYVQEVCAKQGLSGFALVAFYEGEPPALWLSATTDQAMGAAEVCISMAGKHVPDECADCTASGNAARILEPIFETIVQRERIKSGVQEGSVSCH